MSQLDVLSPFSGRIVPLEQVPDPVFAQRLLGDGLAIEPDQGIARSPISGTLVVFHSANHAFAVQPPGLPFSVLVHIGLDTVRLKGKGFTRCAEVGQQVQAGSEIARFNLESIASAGFSTLCPVVVTDLPTGYRLQKTAVHSVRAGADILFTVLAAN